MSLRERMRKKPSPAPTKKRGRKRRPQGTHGVLLTYRATPNQLRDLEYWLRDPTFPHELTKTPTYPFTRGGAEIAAARFNSPGCFAAIKEKP